MVQCSLLQPPEWTLIFQMTCRPVVITSEPPQRSQVGCGSRKTKQKVRQLSNLRSRTRSWHCGAADLGRHRPGTRWEEGAGPEKQTRASCVGNVTFDSKTTGRLLVSGEGGSQGKSPKENKTRRLVRYLGAQVKVPEKRMAVNPEPAHGFPPHPASTRQPQDPRASPFTTVASFR